MNYVRLADLDELTLTVRDKDSRLYIGEAIDAYRGGAYRAAIMSAWIAVVTDIISKIRELAGQGDAKAAAIITNLDNAVQNNNIQQLQKIESELLNQAQNEFEFLSQQESTDLERLKVDRNFCAHPAFVAEGVLFQPQPDLVRAHIVHAITHLLRHQPVQGKSALARIKAEIVRPSFPNELENVEKLLGAKYLDRAKQSLVRNLIASLLAGYLKEDVDLIGKEQALIHVLLAVSRKHPTIYEDTVRAKLPIIIDALNDKQLAKIFRLMGADAGYWIWLTEPFQVRINGVLNSLTPEEWTEHNVFDAVNIAELKETLMKKMSILKNSEKEQVIADKPRPEFADLAAALYAEVGSFRSAERVGNNILLPMSKYFNGEQILKILDDAKTNVQIQHAGGSPEILAEFFDKTLAHLNETKNGWLEFVDEISDDPENHYSYSTLRMKLAEHRVLGTAYPEKDAAL